MTQTAIAVWEPDQQEMDIYRRHYAPANTTNEEWEIFLETCRAYRVSPIRRQIYLVGRYDTTKKRMVNTPQISIGTLRLLALRTNEFEGTTEPEWADEDGAWHTCWPKAKGKHPYAARVGIYRKNFRSPVWGVVYFHELAQKTREGKLTHFWEDSGIHQLAKCAEADGLRKAFEEECGGVYIHEEMLQADSDRPPVSVIPVVESDDPETNEALKETAQSVQPKEAEQPKAKPATQPQANGHQEQEPLATDQQKASIRKLYEHLGREMGEDVATMTYRQAKDAILVLSGEYAKMRERPAPQMQINGDEPQSSIPSIKQLQARCTKLCGAGYWQAMLKVALKLDKELLDKDITIAHRLQIHKYLEYVDANRPATP